MSKIKTLFLDILGISEQEYSKKWMSRFTTAVLFAILFSIPLFFSLIGCHLHFGLSYRMCRVFWEKYISFSEICITAYAVSWLGYMGKAFLAKREEENIKLQYTLRSEETPQPISQEEEKYED